MEEKKEEEIQEEELHYRFEELSLPVAPSLLERETGERRRGRDVLVAIDDVGGTSKYAFDWTCTHFCRLADTIHLVHAVQSLHNKAACSAAQELMDDLAGEAFQLSMVKTVGRIVEGDAGKVICSEAKRVKPVAVIMGTRGRGLIKSVLQGSVSEYCFHHCKCAPVIIVPDTHTLEN